jgi:hypothetical protein
LNFITHAGIAIAIILIGGLVSSTAAFDPADSVLTRLTFGIAALAAQIELFSAALYLRSRSAPRFDMTVAAETLVALGVFSLIVGIVLAAIAMPGLNISAGAVTLADFKPLVISFAEGLLASALAPVLATLLRQIEVLKYAPHSESGTTGEQLASIKREADGVAKALSQLRREMEAITSHTVPFAKGTTAILEGLNEIATNIREAKGIVPTALSSVSKEIGNTGPGVMAAAFNAAADNIRAGSGRVSAAFDGATDNIRAGTGSVSAVFETVADNIRTGASQVSGAFETAANNIRTTGQVSAAFENAANNIRSGAGHVSGAFDNAANNIGAEGGRAAKALAATSSSFGNFAATIASSAEATRKMTDEFDKLSKDAQATTGLLKRLQQLIESVTNFIRPEKS